VARQTELLELSTGDRVLEIGSGSGYQTAVLASIARAVFAIERLSELSRSAQRLLSDLRIGNAIVKCFDGTYGWSDFAPFDAILVAAGGPVVPRHLVNQLE
jgi:protein-L-isoaspartate(D-aspartate) O-methyltransferase